MKTVKYQIINEKDKEPLSDVLTCNANPSTENDRCLVVVADEQSVIEIADFQMLARRIDISLDKEGEGYLAFAMPKRKGWLKSTFYGYIKIIEITDK